MRKKILIVLLAITMILLVPIVEGNNQTATSDISVDVEEADTEEPQSFEFTKEEAPSNRLGILFLIVIITYFCVRICIKKNYFNN